MGNDGKHANVILEHSLGVIQAFLTPLSQSVLNQYLKDPLRWIHGPMNYCISRMRMFVEESLHRLHEELQIKDLSFQTLR